MIGILAWGGTLKKHLRNLEVTQKLIRKAIELSSDTSMYKKISFLQYYCNHAIRHKVSSTAPPKIYKNIGKWYFSYIGLKLYNIYFQELKI